MTENVSGDDDEEVHEVHLASKMRNLLRSSVTSAGQLNTEDFTRQYTASVSRAG